MSPQLDTPADHNPMIEYARRKMNGTSYTTIRQELKEQGYDKKEITNEIELIDSYIFELHEREQEAQRIKTKIGTGIILMILGFGLLLFTFINTLSRGGLILTAYVIMFVVGLIMTVVYAVKLKQKRHPD